MPSVLFRQIRHQIHLVWYVLLRSIMELTYIAPGKTFNYNVARRVSKIQDRCQAPWRIHGSCRPQQGVSIHQNGTLTSEMVWAIWGTVQPLKMGPWFEYTLLSFWKSAVQLRRLMQQHIDAGSKKISAEDVYLSLPSRMPAWIELTFLNAACSSKRLVETQLPSTPISF